MLRLFRNATHEFDSIGPSLGLSSLSERTVKRSGNFSIGRDGPARPTTRAPTRG